MRGASAATTGNANPDTDVDVGRNDVRVGRFFGDDVRVGPFTSIMRRMRRLRPNKVAVELATITGRSVRTAERWLAGDLVPDGEATLSLFLSEVGPAFLETKVAELPPERQEAFWREMGKAQKRADLERRRIELEREIAAERQG